jgi:methylmalonyl-CoA/ethylmalonyl-CoA epimerase
MILGIHHISIGVKDMEKHLEFYRAGLGLDLGEITSLPGVNLGFVPVGNGDLELLEPTDPESDLAVEIREKGEGLHHICFEVDDIEEHLRTLRDAGVHLIDETPREVSLGKIAFIHPDSAGGVLIELLQKP